MCNQVMPGCVAPARPRACAFSFPGRRDQVRCARAFVARFLDGHPAADDAVLLISELAANACAHSDSGRPGGSYMVRIQVREGGRVHAEVEDQGSSLERFVHGNREPARAVPRSLTGGRVRYPPGGPRLGDLVCARATVTSASAWRPRLLLPGRRWLRWRNGPSSGGYYSGARTDIINAHAELRAALDMLVKAAGPDGSGSDRLADLMPQIADAR